MRKIIERLKTSHYLNSGIVFSIDVVTSAISSIIALMLVVISLLHRGHMPASSLTWQWVLSSIVISGTSFYIFHTYRAVIRHTSLHELAKIFFAVALKEGLLFAACFCLATLDILVTSGLALGVMLFVLDFMITVTMLVLVRVCMLLIYSKIKAHSRNPRMNVLIYGADDRAVGTAQRIAESKRFSPSGFITPGNCKSRHVLAGKKVYYYENRRDLEKIFGHADAVLFPSENELRDRSDLTDFCVESGKKVLIVPRINELVDGQPTKQPAREIKIEDLLGRPEIKISMNEIRSMFTGKTVLVTGAAGSIGSELCRQLAHLGVRKMILFDNAETPMHNIRLELEETCPDLDFTPVIGDVRQNQRLDFVFRTHRPQIVFHAAAYKHVPLMEENPCEAVLVNVAGSRNVADKCLEYDVERMVMISTDKAVNPANIMGCTKRLAEIYVQSLGSALEQGRIKGKTRFITTRFGNVLGSNGSVIPRFRAQIASGGPVTVTHPEINRFFMTIPEACRLVMEAATMASATQIFVFDMGEPVKIADLAKRMIELAGLVLGKDIEIAYTGLRPGEKLYEEVLSTAENTLPTDHSRIRIAKVRQYDFEKEKGKFDTLRQLSENVDIPAMVRLMKEMVPEFISKNSEFEKFDNTGSGK